MEEQKNITKISFFKKVWYSITKFEMYPSMAAEGVKKAIKYLIVLSAIVTIFISVEALIQSKDMMQDLSNYIQENIPEFTYDNGELSMNMNESIVIEDVEYSGIDRIVINTLHETEEQKKEIKEDNLITGITVIFFKDEIVLEAKNERGQIAEQPYTYNEFLSSYISGDIEKFDKQEFIEILDSKRMISYYSQYALTTFISLFIANILVVLLDTLEVAIIGWFATIIARIKMKFSGIYSMAAYSMTLSIILNIIYIIINYFTRFTITYFQVAYITIACIYLIAAIFILKDDIIKKMQEVEKIKQEQKKVREEIKEELPKKNKEKKDPKQKKEKKEENNEGEHPQGSEV